MSESEEDLKMKRLLHTRLHKRRFGQGGGSHYRLDLRRAGLSGERLVVRDPKSKGWPDRGRPARTQTEALAWVDEYVDRLGAAWFKGAKELGTVSEYGEAYLRKLEDRTGGGSTYRNYRSALRHHIEPRVGSEVLRTLGATQVQELLDSFRTTGGTKPGKVLRVTVLSVLGNIWRFAFGRDSAPPWAGKIEVDHVNPAVRRRQRAEGGVRTHERGKGYTALQLHRIMVAAVALDLVGDANPQKRRGMENYAETVASLIYQIVRVEELTFVRHKDVDRTLRGVCVPGTKTHAAEERFAPIQIGYEPWLERALGRGTDPEHFLLPTSAPERLPSVATIKGKVERVLRAADLKRPGTLTHTFRGTAMSFALGAGLSADEVAILAGHRLPDDPLINLHYLRWASFLQGLGERAFEFMPHLGTPEELEEEARRAIRAGKLKL